MSIQQGLTGASGGTSSSFGSAYPATGTASGAKDGSGNMAALNLDSSGQLKAAANLRNSSGTEIATLANPVRVDPTGTTTQPISAASLPLPAGAATSAKQPALGTAGSASSDVLSVQGIASMTALKVDGSAVTQPASLVPATSGGLSSSKLISAASTNATSVKGSAGQLYNVQAFNTNAAARYLKLYNKASAPTVGTDTPIATWLIPPSSSGFVIEISNGLALSTGIAFALTTGIADADTGAVAASEIAVNLQYK